MRLHKDLLEIIIKYSVKPDYIYKDFWDENDSNYNIPHFDCFLNFAFDDNDEKKCPICYIKDISSPEYKQSVADYLDYILSSV
jgi:hypothetical protein